MNSRGNMSGFGREWQQPSSDFRQRYSGGMLSQPWFLVVAASAVIVATGWMVSRFPPRYQATATVRCVLKDASAEQTVPGLDQLRSMILDRQVVEPAMQKLEFKTDSKLLAQLNEHFTIRSEWESSDACLVQIGFEYRDPTKAQLIASEVAHTFVNVMRQSDQSRQQAQVVAEKSTLLAEAENHWLQEFNQLKQLHSHPKFAMLQGLDDQLQQVEAKLAEKLKERDAVAQQVKDDLPTAPPLKRMDNQSSRTLAQMSLQDCIKQRAELVSIYTDKLPAVANLDRKIRQLAMQAGEESLTTDEGIRQASFEIIEQKQRKMQSADELSMVIDNLQEQRQMLREQLELKTALERELNDQRAKVDSLFAKKNQCQEELVEAQRQLQILEDSNPLDYQLPETGGLKLKFLGPDRRKWFAGIAMLTLSLTMCCWWWGRLSPAHLDF